MERYVGYFADCWKGWWSRMRSEMVDGLGMLGEEERKQVLYEWNETEREYPEEQMCA